MADTDKTQDEVMEELEDSEAEQAEFRAVLGRFLVK